MLFVSNRSYFSCSTNAWYSFSHFISISFFLSLYYYSNSSSIFSICFSSNYLIFFLSISSRYCRFFSRVVRKVLSYYSKSNCCSSSYSCSFFNFSSYSCFCLLEFNLIFSLIFFTCFSYSYSKSFFYYSILLSTFFFASSNSLAFYSLYCWSFFSCVYLSRGSAPLSKTSLTIGWTKIKLWQYFFRVPLPPFQTIAPSPFLLVTGRFSLFFFVFPFKTFACNTHRKDAPLVFIV